MKKIRILVAAMLGAAVVAGVVPATNASATIPPPLTITCHQNPSFCIATGQVGPIIGETFLSPRGDEALVCVSLKFFCDVAGAELFVEPRDIFAAAVLLNNFGELVLQTRFIGLELASGTLNYALEVIANNGVEAVILLTPGHHKCLFIVGLTITAPPC